MFKKDDYVEGTEHYGHITRRIKGWIDRIKELDSGDLIIDIQCDDNYKGYRGNTIYSSLGEIVKLEDKPRIKTRFSE